MKIQDKKNKLQRMWLACTLISEYEASNYGCGGSLHIILDDGNYDDSDIILCSNNSYSNNDVFGIHICQILGKMSVNERRAIVEKSYLIEQAIRK